MKILETLGRMLVLMTLVTRCATQSDSGSQTHWLGTCDRDGQCSAGLACHCGRCMKTCGSGSCTGLDRSAECVASSSAAHDAVCGAVDVTSVCLPKCESGCQSTERCIDGVCAPQSAPREGGVDASPCPEGQILTYETAGCGADAKKVCVGPYFDACIMEVCGCDGVTFSAACGNSDKPFAHLGACKVGGKEAGAALDGSNRPGVPCAECNLPTQIARLAASGSEDCGRIAVDAGGAASAACAHTAFQGGRPFTLVMDQAGTDSYVATAWVFTAGRLHVLTYDSNICGGGPTCDNPRCGPRVSEAMCNDPTPSTVPRTVFACGSISDSQAICEPLSN